MNGNKISHKIPFTFTVLNNYIIKSWKSWWKRKVGWSPFYDHYDIGQSRIDETPPYTWCVELQISVSPGRCCYHYTIWLEHFSILFLLDLVTWCWLKGLWESESVITGQTGSKPPLTSHSRVGTEYLIGVGQYLQPVQCRNRGTLLKYFSGGQPLAKNSLWTI